MRLMVLRATCWKSTTALVVISPASTTRPVLQSVSAATREYLSSARMASRMASEIWSATLSGWPSETDSEVNRKLWLMISSTWSECSNSKRAEKSLVSLTEQGFRELVVLRAAGFYL